MKLADIIHRRTPRVVSVLALIGASFGLTLTSSTQVSATPAACPTNGVCLTNSLFESGDGDLVPNPAYASTEDWSSVATNQNFTPAYDLPSGTSDNAFGQGAKEDGPCPTVVYGSIPPNKSDLTRFYTFHELGTDSTSHMLYLAWERSNTLGNANMDFEFNQGTATCTNSANGRTNVMRTARDVLFTFDFGGSGTPDIAVLYWLTSAQDSVSDCFSANSLPCWGKRHDLTANGPTNSANGAVNSATVSDSIAAPPGAPGSSTLPAGTFGEAGINLDLAGVFNNSACTSFGSAFLTSRSSSSFTSEIKDFIAPVPENITNCGRIVVNKTDPNGNLVAGAKFKVTPGQTTGTPPTTATSTPMTEGPNGVFCVDHLLTTTPGGGAQTYTVTETAPPPGYSISGTNPQTGISPVAGSCDSSVTVSTTPQATFTDTPISITTSATSSVTVGGTIQDTAYLTGASSPTGQITFSLYSDSACQNLVASYPTGGTDTEGVTGSNLATVTVGGTTYTNDGETSASFSTTTAGTTYYWIASYLGDANNGGPITGKCQDPGETSTVTQAPTTLSTNVVLGDTVTVNSSTGLTSGDTATFSLYKGDSTCSNASDLLNLSNGNTSYTGPVTVTSTGGTASTTATYTVPTADGGSTYYWKVVFNGDTNNATSNSSCLESAAITYK